MKTKLALTILGGYNTLMGLIMLAMPGEFASQAVAEHVASDANVLECFTLFHYGLSPALLMIGLTLLLIRKSAVETAKNALLAYAIGTGVLISLFFTVFSSAEIMNFSIEMAAPDILAFGLAIFAYLKGK
ncbi:MAG TPA: hypothetical protein DD635_02085 [Flavobacteriales bacterium]|nr:hypothetical protein [Flavobacteriales bacterium]|tara:strand:+ start:5781 stop:6170 length:390 start_codon:yes stop_codon:yes gene_type:complete